MYEPLVTICIPNYNYGRYLRTCLESILKQTYANLEVHFSDNASTDDSYEIAQEYRKKFREKGIYFKVLENKRTVTSDKNSKLAAQDAEGEYICTLASDDAIKPTFVERCVAVLEHNPDVGTVITHREEMDDDGGIYQIPPFYNADCIVDSESQAAVHMMAGIAIPGQRVVRKSVLNQVKPYLREFQVAGDWYDNFLYALAGKVAYITEPLCQYRVHRGNETNESELKLLGSMEHYQLLNAFCDLAESFGLKKPQARYAEAVQKLGAMCLRYALKMYKNGRGDVAYRYLLLAPVYDPELLKEEPYKLLLEMKALCGAALEQAIFAFEDQFVMERNNSYDPPDGYVRIGTDGKPMKG
ncbi:MAG: glycosyltransferase family 2 protein [Firmicutes bacterium]|nr:glycosyltransferase family 2 protein [Bacillota bacterium]